MDESTESNGNFYISCAKKQENFGTERRKDMEWLPFIVIAIFVGILGLYYIVKWAVKDALREYFKDKDSDESGDTP